MNVFESLKIIELGRVYSSPLCGMVLSDLGAQVIKIERPDIGDESRHFGESDQLNRSCYFDSLNRNKASMSLDLKNKEDQDVLIELIKESDVLIHNWLQKSLDKLGFSYEAVHAINPRLIYCVISGYGYNSPYRDKPSQDIIAQSLSGLMSLTGEPGRVPIKTGIPVVDYATGMNAAFAIMSALYMRTFSGEGQLVHTSLLETALSITSFEASKYLKTGQIPQPKGNRHPAICPYNVYECSDGLITIAIANDAMWLRFCQVLNLETLAKDNRYIDNVRRLENQDNLEQILLKVIKKESCHTMIQKLDSAFISCTKVNNLEDGLRSLEVQALEMIKTLDDGTRVIGKSFTLEAIEETYLKAPPELK